MNPSAWCQANIAFRDWDSAEATALARISPLLRTAEDEEAITAWFIVRKRPCWRVRYQPAVGGTDPMCRGLDVLTTQGHIEGWTQAVYEPEVHAFGGPEAMASAHRLFHRDSRNILGLVQNEAGTHRRETSLILCGLLMRSAGLDWYEQGDIWARVSDHRPLPSGSKRDDGHPMHTAVRRLLCVDPTYATRPNGPLAHAAERARAYAQAGAELAELTASGRLHRGLRDVLAHHVIFAWNRIGLPYAIQAALTAAAKSVVFGLDSTTGRSTANRVETT